jgi:hypothetical protein
MRQTQITSDLVNALGQTVLDFGFMESAIRTMIIVLSRERNLAKALVPSSNGVSENLDLLHRLCHHRISPEALDDWYDAIKDIRSLFVERNKIFHGMFFEREERLFLAKVRKGNRGSPDEWTKNEFDPSSVRKILQQLGDRRRQLMDFADDYSSNDDGPPHSPSQKSYPSLSVKGNNA